MTRPYSSLSGASTSGPQANPSTNTDTAKVAKLLDVVWNSAMTDWMPGASIEDTKGLTGRGDTSQHLASPRWLRHLHEKAQDGDGQYVGPFLPPVPVQGICRILVFWLLPRNQHGCTTGCIGVGGDSGGGRTCGFVLHGMN